MTTRRLAVAVVGMAAVGCATNPATGKHQLSLVPQSQEIAMGKEAAAEVSQSIGLYDNARLQEYVSGVGHRLAATSERPDLPWSFKVVDDSAVNAFALPGGPIFVTRGLLAHMENEAQLASVIGHEIGHVTAKHSVSQISKAQLAQLGLGLGMVFSDTVRELGQLGMAGMQVLFLKFGRDDENQADELGLRYALRARYDAREMPPVFATLKRVSEEGEGSRLPEWLSTHPDPEHRIEKVEARLAKQPLPKGLAVKEEAYLQAIDGIMFGPDPREGFFRGDRFLHPGLRFTVAFPRGWQHANLKEAVMAASPDQDALVQITAAKGQQRDPRQALAAFLSRQGITGGQTGRTASSLPSAASEFVAKTEQGDLAGIVSFIEHDGKVFQLLAVTTPEKIATYAATFTNVPATFGALTDATVINVQPARLHVLRTPRPMTLADLYRERPASVPLETVAVVNQMQPTERLQPGEPVKWVTGGAPQAVGMLER
jgi:predicted Zn-dependent protease